MDLFLKNILERTDGEPPRDIGARFVKITRRRHVPFENFSPTPSFGIAIFDPSVLAVLRHTPKANTIHGSAGLALRNVSLIVPARATAVAERQAVCLRVQVKLASVFKNRSVGTV